MGTRAIVPRNGPRPSQGGANALSIGGKAGRNEPPSGSAKLRNVLGSVEIHRELIRAAQAAILAEKPVSVLPDRRAIRRKFFRLQKKFSTGHLQIKPRGRSRAGRGPPCRGDCPAAGRRASYCQGHPSKPGSWSSTRPSISLQPGAESRFRALSGAANFDARGVHHRHFGVWLITQGIEYRVKHTRPRPIAKAPADRIPVAETLRQIPPGRAGALAEHRASLASCTPGFSPGRTGNPPEPRRRIRGWISRPDPNSSPSRTAPRRRCPSAMRNGSAGSPPDAGSWRQTGSMRCWRPAWWSRSGRRWRCPRACPGPAANASSIS